MAGWLHGDFVGEWLFVFPLCGFSLSLFCNHTTAMAPPVHRAPQLSALELAWQCSYKRVKGRGHTAEKRISMHPHKPHATSQPLRPSQWLCSASADVMMGRVYGAVFVVVLVLR